jgi:hypothetical protein
MEALQLLNNICQEAESQRPDISINIYNRSHGGLDNKIIQQESDCLPLPCKTTVRFAKILQGFSISP